MTTTVALVAKLTTEKVSPMPAIRHRFSADDYYRMLEVGILAEGARVELVNGEICNMSPIDPIHAANVMRLDRQLQRLVGDNAIINVQNPIRLNDYNERQPDLAVLRWDDDFYAQRHPTPEDVLLVVEVANTSLASDRNEKLPAYATAGIPEVWLINVARQSVEQYTQPRYGQYSQKRIIYRGEILVSTTVPEIALPVDSIFGH